MAVRAASAVVAEQLTDQRVGGADDVVDLVELGGRAHEPAHVQERVDAVEVAERDGELAQRLQQRAARRLLALLEREVVAEPAGEVDAQRRPGDGHQSRRVGDPVVDDDRPVAAVDRNRLGQRETELVESFR